MRKPLASRTLSTLDARTIIFDRTGIVAQLQIRGPETLATRSQRRRLEAQEDQRDGGVTGTAGPVGGLIFEHPHDIERTPSSSAFYLIQRTDPLVCSLVTFSI